MWLFGRISNVITESSSEPKHTMAAGRLLLNLSANEKERPPHHGWLCGTESEEKKIKIIFFLYEPIHQRKSSCGNDYDWPHGSSVQLHFSDVAAIPEHVRETVKLIKQKFRRRVHIFFYKWETNTFAKDNSEGRLRDRTQFLWRKPSETEAHLHVAPLVGTSMSWLSGPGPRYKVSSQNQGLSVVGHPPSHWQAERGMGCADQQLNSRSCWGQT